MRHKITFKKRTKQFTRRWTASLILVLMLASLPGCGKSQEKVPAPSVEPIDAQASSAENEVNSSEGNGNNSSEENKQEEESNSGEIPTNEKNSNDSSGASQGDSAPQNAYAPQSDSELDGTVKTIGTDSFVVSQHFTMPSENSEDAELMVAPAEGSEDEVLITVYTTGDTTYTIRTVKNGGVNGDSDREDAKGSFTDIQEKASVNAKGHYEGGEFWADSIIIYHFV